MKSEIALIIGIIATMTILGCKKETIQPIDIHICVLQATGALQAYSVSKPIHTVNNVPMGIGVPFVVKNYSYIQLLSVGFVNKDSIPTADIYIDGKLVCVGTLMKYENYPDSGKYEWGCKAKYYVK